MSIPSHLFDCMRQSRFNINFLLQCPAPTIGTTLSKSAIEITCSLNTQVRSKRSAIDEDEDEGAEVFVDTAAEPTEDEREVSLLRLQLPGVSLSGRQTTRFLLR